MHRQDNQENRLIVLAFLTSIFVSSYVIAPLLAIKIATIGFLTLPAGDIIYAMTFIAMDSITQLFGSKLARKVVLCGFLSLVSVYFFTQIALYLPSMESWPLEQSYNQVFNSGVRIFLATMCAYLVSQLSDIYVFSKIRNYTGNNIRTLWLRSAGSTAVARLLDAITFSCVAFIGTYSLTEIIEIVQGAYLAGIIVTIISIPLTYLCVYFSSKWMNKG